MKSAVLIFVITSLEFLLCLHGAKILVFPGPFSHYSVMSQIAHALNQRGHKITFISSKGNWVTKQDHFDLWTYGGDQSDFEKSMNQFFKNSLAGKSQFDSEQMADRQAAFTKQLEGFFKETPSLREKALTEKFDLAIADAFMLQSMYLIKSLDLPFIIFACGAFDPVQHARLAQSPSPSAYVPVGFTPLQMTDRMTFLERLTNTALYFVNQLVMKYYFSTMNQYVQTYLPEVQHLSYDDIMADAELWIANTDFTLEFPRALSPNVVYVGGLTSKHPQPLPKDLETFVSGSGDAGVIVFSLGTTIKDMEPTTSQVFADVFSALPQRVIWRYAGKEFPTVPANVKLMQWIPQNDLLGHSKTRLFINHGGISGTMESIYHGVPIVAIPIFGDQFDIVSRVVAKGLGVRVDVTNVTRINLSTAIKRVLEEPRFASTAKDMSAIMKSRPLHPLNRTAHWVDYVIKHGGRHLRPASHDLSFIQYFLLDVIACIIAVLVFVLWLVKTILCCCCRCCRKKNVKSKVE